MNGNSVFFVFFSILFTKNIQNSITAANMFLIYKYDEIINNTPHKKKLSEMYTFYIVNVKPHHIPVAAFRITDFPETD